MITVAVPPLANVNTAGNVLSTRLSTVADCELQAPCAFKAALRASPLRLSSAVNPDPRNSMPAKNHTAALPKAAKHFEFLDVKGFSFSFQYR